MEEGQAESNQTWRVAEELQKMEEVAEPDGLRHAERYKKASVAEHGLTAPAAELESHEARDKMWMEGPVESCWELPRLEHVALGSSSARVRLTSVRPWPGLTGRLGLTKKLSHKIS